MAKIDSAYAYYVSNYAHKEVSRYDSHKKSDLRKVYLFPSLIQFQIANVSPSRVMRSIASFCAGWAAT